MKTAQPFLYGQAFILLVQNMLWSHGIRSKIEQKQGNKRDNNQPVRNHTDSQSDVDTSHPDVKEKKQGIKSKSIKYFFSTL